LIFCAIRLAKILATGGGLKYIEIGYGSGIFAYEFYRLGFEVFGFDSSEIAYDTANAIFNTDKRRISLKKELVEEDNEAFDFLGAYEVLEHIKDDIGVLRQWRELLSENGILLISVPAHMKDFGIRDKWAGHVRRYEKEQLCLLLQEAGFEIVKIISYGFPFPKLMNKLIEILVDKPHLERMKKAEDSHKTGVSGVERAEEYRFRKVLPYRIFVLFSKIQRIFYDMDLGIGYLVMARKI